MDMKEITLNEFLSGDNPWTARLIGYEHFQKTRNSAQIEQEYDSVFYGNRLAEYQADPDKFNKTSIYGPDKEIFASVGDRIFKMPYSVYATIKRSSFLSLLDRFNCSGELCELGAGNGQNHFWIKAGQKRPVYGGEYSANAVKLAGLLDLEVYHFNFYNIKDYCLIRSNTTVFTMHAVEQIPDVSCIINGLKSKRENINRVVHFEPLYRSSRNDLLGRLRNRYAEINDYNRNLLECLRTDSEIIIEHLEEDAFGNNPLNPASIIVWRFR